MSKRMKREVLGTISIDPRDFTKERGHEYGKGRAAAVHKHRTEKRTKQKLHKELTW
jgi:cytochrome oxidase Cu insertion factor (SCO1/SenC/PrrC family)